METRLRILVVEDDSGVRGTLGELIANDGHIVTLAIDGADGLEKFRDAEFDLVITDNNMPRMNGDRLASSIQELSPNFPIIMMSGKASQIEMPAGVRIILGKPSSLAQVREAIAAATKDPE